MYFIHKNEEVKDEFWRGKKWIIWMIKIGNELKELFYELKVCREGESTKLVFQFKGIYFGSE